MGKRKNSKRTWEEDDQVVVLIDNEPYRGTVLESSARKSQVLFEDGDNLSIATHRLLPYECDEPFDDVENLGEDDTKDRDKESNVGFNQFNVHWDKHAVNFKFNAGGGLFYGWWRKTGTGAEIKPLFAVDIHVKYKGNSYNVESIQYYDGDPHEDRYSLDSDICAACNKWFFYKANGNFDTIEGLQQKADKPTLYFNRIEALDKIIINLKGFRDTAIRCGGRRILILEGTNKEKDPSGGVRLQVDFTTQAHGLKGRVPSLYAGAILDNATSVEGRKKNAKREQRPKIIGDQKSIDQLITQLKNSTDKTEKRKIRAMLRKMGHSGGARNS